MLTLQLTLAARYLGGRKLRSFLTALAIVFGAWLIFAMNILMPTMLKAFQVNMLAASDQVDVTITHKTGETFSRNLLNKVRTIKGMSAVSGLLSRTIAAIGQWAARRGVLGKGERFTEQFRSIH